MPRTQPSSGSRSKGRLRRDAEAHIARAPRPASQPNIQELLHELQVHQIELEMQNQELQRAQIDLEQSRDRYSALYDYAPVGYLTLDRAGTILEANLTAAAMLGLDRSVLAGWPLAAFLERDHSAAFMAHQQAVFARETKQGCDVWLRRRGGPSFPAHLDSIVELESADPAGGRTRCRTVIVDVTELRRVQDDVRTHESRTRTLLDSAPDAIVTSDAEGRIESLNTAAEQLFGYREAEVRGRPLTLLMPPAPAGEARGVRKDGTSCAIEVTSGEWSDHGAHKLTTIVRDVSARARAERALQESEARFRQIAEHIEDAFTLREPSGAITYVSPAYERIWGCPAHALVGKPSAWLETVDPADRDRVEQAWRRMLTGEPVSEVYRIWRPDGTMRWVHSRAFPVRGPDGSVQRYVGVVRDVTVERELEAGLRHSQKMEAVGTLASGVAHNLRNVLQAILAFISIAQREEAPADRRSHALQRAASTATRGALLTDQMMMFTRKGHAALHRFELDGEIGMATVLLEALVGPQIIFEVATGAPAAMIVGEPVHIEQILLNLAGNARDAMPHGGRLAVATAEVVLTPEAAQQNGLTRAGRYAKLTVRDSGTGMDEATRARVFEPFFTTKSVGRGTGLGLFTVFALVNQLGGCISVASQEGQGTTFTILLPCSEPAAAAE